MKSISTLIRGRRTIHHFKSKPIPQREIILEAINCAIWAPNHLLTEPWRFHLLGRHAISQICSLKAQIERDKKGEKAASFIYKRWNDIPGWFVMTCNKSDNQLRQKEDYAACCCAIQNLMLFLWSNNIGVKWNTGTVTRDERLCDIIGTDFTTTDVVGIFWYGYAADVPKMKRKPSLDVWKDVP